MAWEGSPTTIMNAVSVAGTEQFSSAVTLNPGELIDIEVKGNSNGTTDSLIINVYTRLDGTNWQTVPRMGPMLLDCTDGNDNLLGFALSGLYEFRIGCVRDGSTDTIATTIIYRKDGVSL